MPDWRFDWNDRPTRAYPPGWEAFYIRLARWTDPHPELMPDVTLRLERGAKVSEVVARARADAQRFEAFRAPVGG